MSVGAGIHAREWEATFGGTSVIFTELNYSISHSPSETTGSQSGQYTEYHAEPGTSSMTITATGVARNNSWLKSASAGGSQAYLLNAECLADNAGTSGSQIDGTFFLATLEQGGGSNELMTFSVTLQSSGAWTFTDPVA